MRRSFEARGRPGFLADLGLDQRRADKAARRSRRRASVLLLAALAARGEQDAAVVDELLSREAAQPISGRDRQAGVPRQQKPQLHGARHLVDVLAAGTGGTDEFPFQFLVGNDDVLGDDEGHGGTRSVEIRGRVVHDGSRAAPPGW